MTAKTRIDSTAAKSRPASRSGSSLRIAGAVVLGIGGFAVGAVAAAWGAGWGADPLTTTAPVNLKPALIEALASAEPEPFDPEAAPFNAAAQPFVVVASVATVTDINQFRSSGEVAVTPGWIFGPEVQTRRVALAMKPADEPMASAMPLPPLPPGTASQSVEIAKTAPRPMANPLFAGRIGTDDLESKTAQDPGAKFALAPLPPRNPMLGSRSGLPDADVAATPAPEAPTIAEPEAPKQGLTLPGPNDRYAVYDVRAKKVYLPDGQKLEAHSGYGDKFDNPRYFHVKMLGPTPPNTYKLTMREALFHGTEAIRMTPIGDGEMYNRNGILAHPYLLGPRGDSNGCVSVKDYDKFLVAFKSGQINQIVVVESMPRGPSSTNPLISWLTSRRG